MVACMLIYSHVTNRRRRIGRKTFSTYSCYAEFRKSTPYLRQKTRRRVDIEQPLGLDNIKIIVDNSLEWRIFHDPRRNDRSFSPPPRQRGRRAIKPSFAASHISQGRRFGAGRSPQTAWRLLRDRGCAPARDGRSARRICPNRGARARSDNSASAVLTRRRDEFTHVYSQIVFRAAHSSAPSSAGPVAPLSRAAR